LSMLDTSGVECGFGGSEADRQEASW
jgi:hypothetical protein